MCLIPLGSVIIHLTYTPTINQFLSKMNTQLVGSITFRTKFNSDFKKQEKREIIPIIGHICLFIVLIIYTDNNKQEVRGHPTFDLMPNCLRISFSITFSK